MKIVVAFDTFKGCVNGYEASEYVASGLTEHGAEAYALPLADGGEGTARALALLYGGTPVCCGCYCETWYKTPIVTARKAATL